MSAKAVNAQRHIVSRKLYIAGFAAKVSLVGGVVVQALFMPSLGSVHVALPFVLSMANIASVVAVIALNHVITKRLIDVASESIEKKR